MKTLLILITLIAILLTACTQSATPTSTLPPAASLTQTPVSTQDPRIATGVAATLTAQAMPATPTQAATSTLTPQPSQTATVAPTTTVMPTETLAPTLTPSPTPIHAGVAGKLCYPAEAIPAMTAYFQDNTTGDVTALPIAGGQITYTLTLTPGTYIAYAWLPDFSLGGLYSKAVPCGLSTSCDDHAAIPFTVKAGSVTKGIDICDWYTGPFVIPYPPGQEPTATVGTIEGSISYPGGNPPALTVVAFNVKTKFWYWVGTVAGGSYFSIEDLPPGTYHVVAYTENGQAGGYADGAHNLIDIAVKAGQTASVEINDWEGSFPANPVK